MSHRLMFRSALLALILLAFPARAAMTPVAVTWGNKVLIDTAGTQISKTAGENELYDSGALTSESITAEGTFTFTLAAMGGFKVGLSTDAATDNTPSHYWQFISEVGIESAQVREASAGWVASAEAQIGDTFSIAIGPAGEVSFLRNGALIYTSEVAATLPTKLDFSALVSGSAISGATIDTGDVEPIEGDVLTVCGSGCDYTTVQAAVTAATADTVILLEEGETFVEDVSLPVKSGVGADAQVTIRTGVNATGVIQSTARYPAAGIRVCPDDYDVDDYDCAGKAGELDITRYATIQPATNNAYAIRTANTGSGTPVSYYTIQGIRLIPNAFAGNALIGITNETASANGDPTAHLPHHITIDRNVIGVPETAQFRGIQGDGNNLTIKNNHFTIQHASEGQAFWANTSIGPILFENNYGCCSAEVFLTGGGGTTIAPTFTVNPSPSPTTTQFGLSGTTDLYVGKTIAMHVQAKTVTSIASGASPTVTTSAAHSYVVGNQVSFSGVSGCTAVNYTNGAFRVASTPTSTTFTVNATCATSGTGGTVKARAAAEITAIAGSLVTVSPALPHTPVEGDTAETSLVIRDLTVRYNYFTRPSAWRTSNPNSWQVKNTFELKQGRESTIEYNLIENSWVAGQSGPCVVFTGTQQNAEADSAVVRDIDLRFNVIRHCAQYMQMSGTDALGHESGRAGDIRITDNLWYDGGEPWGTTYGMIWTTGGSPRQTPNRMPDLMVMEHNTIHAATDAPSFMLLLNSCHDNPVQAPSTESLSHGASIKNNIIYNGQFGLGSIGVSQASCNDGISAGRLGTPLNSASALDNNVIVGGTCTLYDSPDGANNTCPVQATFEAAAFTSTSTISGFAVKDTSVYFAGGTTDATDGESMGADIAAIETAMLITESGDNGEDDPTPTPPTRFRLRIIRGN